MSKIGIIIGSTRPGRIGANVTNWVNQNLPKSEGIEYEIIDLAEWNLPLFDERLSPSKGMYENAHTKKWASFIEDFKAFIFVTAEYNAGYPAALKNAIDYLKAEWVAKPALVISYGWDGGTSSNNQLREVLTRVGASVIESHPALAFTGSDMFGVDGEIKDIDKEYGKYASEVKTAGQQLLDALLVMAG